jgi:hypothetical protein
MKSTLLTALAVVAAVSVPAPFMTAGAQGGYCPVSGRYSVLGRQPGASGTYRGEALISATATGCQVRWFPPNDSVGTGDYSNGVLTIYFTFAQNGASGVVKYNRASNGELHGTWWMNGNEGNQGTETLRPK